MHYFKQVESDIIKSVEAKSTGIPSPGFVEVTKEEYDAFMASIPPTVKDPSHSTHISVLVSVDPAKARPAKVKRIWEGREYLYDCFVTQTCKDEFQAGKIAVGDYVIVHFDERGEQLVMGKVYKSW